MGEAEIVKLGCTHVKAGNTARSATLDPGRVLGEPSSDKEPSDATLKTAMEPLLPGKFATKRNVPSWFVAIPTGWPPLLTGNGEPGTSVKWPF